MDKNQIREVIARRAALELKDGDVVNLGIGLPTLIPNYLPEGVKVTLQSENGLLGMGPEPELGKEDRNFTNAGGGYITFFPWSSAFDSSMSFSSTGVERFRCISHALSCGAGFGLSSMMKMWHDSRLSLRSSM